MTTTAPATRYPLDFAWSRAQSLMRTLAPYCERIEVGGSIRRALPTVKDIELIAIPKWGEGRPEQYDMFGDALGARRTNALIAYLRSLGVTDRNDQAKYIKFTAGPAIDGDRDGINVDLFLATPAHWGLIYLIRTGSADFAKGMLARWKAVTDGGFSRDGYLHRHVSPIETPEEVDVFRLCEVPVISPPERVDARAIMHALRRAAR